MTVEQPSARQRLTLVDHQPFFPRSREYRRQYAGMYWFRLEALRPHVKSAAVAKWSDVKIVDKIFDIAAGTVSCVIGTIFVEAEHKPNVLEDLAIDVRLVFHIH